VALESP
jgi:transposase